jgi:hypothetical protein
MMRGMVGCETHAPIILVASWDTYSYWWIPLDDAWDGRLCVACSYSIGGLLGHLLILVASLSDVEMVGCEPYPPIVLMTS